MTPRQELARDFRAAILATVERRPVTEAPEEGTLSSVDNGTLDQLGSRRMLAKFAGGKWVRENGGPLPFEPGCWLRFRDPKEPT